MSESPQTPVEAEARTESAHRLAGLELRGEIREALGTLIAEKARVREGRNAGRVPAGGLDRQ